MIPCTGVAILPTAEERLILLVFYVGHLKRTAWPYPTQFSAARIFLMIEIT